MSLMNILIIVETPLQLLCAYEAIKSKQSKYTLILRCTSVGNNDIQLIRCAKLLNLEYIEINAFVGKKLMVALTLISFLFKFRLFGKYDEVYFGSLFSNYQKLLSKFFFKNKVFFMDDGMASLLTKEFNLNTFSFFNLPPSSKALRKKHNFESLRLLLRDYDNNKVGHYFVGQPFIDKEMITIDEYKRMVETASSTVGFLYYIPHRVERKETIELVLSGIENVKVININECIELYFVMNGFYPEGIHTCCSTSIYTLSKLFPTANMNVYLPRDDRITNLEHWVDVKNVILSIEKIVSRD